MVGVWEKVIRMIDILIAFTLGTLFGAFSILLWAASVNSNKKGVMICEPGKSHLLILAYIQKTLTV